MGKEQNSTVKVKPKIHGVIFRWQEGGGTCKEGADPEDSLLIGLQIVMVEQGETRASPLSPPARINQEGLDQAGAERYSPF